MFTTRIATSVVVDAPAADVWRLLTDLPGYRDWNPYLHDAEGHLVPGRTVTVRATLPGGRSGTSVARVVRVSPDRELRWTSGPRGLLRADHRFRLVAEAPHRTRLEQDETFTGLLVPVLGRTIERIRAGCDAMGRALAERLETRRRPGPAGGAVTPR